MMTAKHGESDERDVKIAIDDLVTQKVQVAGVHPNVDQEVILVTEDKVRLCLNENFAKAARSKHWTTIAGLIATLVMTLTTAQYRDFAGLTSQEWRGISIAALVASAVWFLASLKWAIATPTLDDIVRQLKEGSRKIAREESVIAVAGDQNLVLVNENPNEAPSVSHPPRTLWRFLTLSESPDMPAEVGMALQTAQELFQRALQKLPNAGEELLTRLEIGNSARQFLGLGYAPNEWSYLLTEYPNADLLHRAGLATPRAQTPGYYDRFRNRVTIPIRHNDRVIGFVGVSTDGSDPRLFFSPESTFFSRTTAIEYLKSVPELRVITGV